MPFVDISSHRIEYERIEARGSGRPELVFLHEGLGSIAMWRDFPERVARETRCDAIVYSRYGYGNSDPLAERRGARYMHDEALVALPRLLDHLGVERPILIGHSDGASIALIHAGAGKWPVRGLVLMAPHVFVEEVTVTSIAAAKVTFETTDLATKLGRYHDDAVSTFWGWNDIWLHPDFRYWNIEEYLPGITSPVLLIQGEDDQYGTKAQVDAIAGQVAGPAEVLMLPRCAHSPHVDQREATVGAIAEFVEKVKK